jgi:hypothetical protein
MAKAININAGYTYALTKLFDDSGIGNTVFTINKTNAIRLDEVSITSLAKGKAVITAVVDKKKYTMTINVYDPQISGTDTLLLDNKTSTLKIINGTGATTWESSNPEIVTISNKGVIKGLKKGHATITAVNNNRTLTWDVNVFNVPKFEKQYTTTVDTPIQVNFTKDSDMPEPVYSVSNKKLAMISESGILTPIKKGTVTVTAAIGGKKYTTKVVINDTRGRG